MMKRREFLKKASQAGCSAWLLTEPLIKSFTHDPGHEESCSFVIAHGGNIQRLVKEAIEAIGGMKRFISKGDIVMVKPNIGWDRTPKQAANTNPDVVHALVRLIYEAGAKKVKVADNTCNEPRRCYRRSGIYEAAQRAGADVYFLDERKLIKATIGGTILKTWPVYKDFIEVDKMVNVPVAKHHGLTRLTLGMKNLMGTLGGRRNSIHQEIHYALPELVEFFQPSLTVIDAIRILTANGPQGGRMSDVKRINTIIAGTEIATVDALAANLFSRYGGPFFKDWKPSDYPFIKIASERGLGRIDLPQVKVKEIEL